ncbi:UNVERIFIED_CONTAM: hypothetical protein DES50_108204 [Williamsia faeni]
MVPSIRIDHVLELVNWPIPISRAPIAHGRSIPLSIAPNLSLPDRSVWDLRIQIARNTLSSLSQLLALIDEVVPVLLSHGWDPTPIPLAAK